MEETTVKEVLERLRRENKDLTHRLEQQKLREGMRETLMNAIIVDGNTKVVQDLVQENMQLKEQIFNLNQKIMELAEELRRKSK